MRTGKWLAGFFAIFAAATIWVGSFTYRIDPFFHYHKPDTTRYFYTLDNERSQNDGICKHFEYDTLITGTSMAANFRASEADELWNCNAIKVIFLGGSYKEVNDNVEKALRENHELKRVIRALDATKFFEPWDTMRLELGSYPTYLYDNNPINDVEYLLNRDVVFGRAYHIIDNRNYSDFKPGITSFDNYSRWQEDEEFGIGQVLPDGIDAALGEQQDRHLTEDDKAIISESVSRNLTGVADKYPEVEFCYFYTPYSIAHWMQSRGVHDLARQMEAEEYITSLILEHENIRLFSFDSRSDILTDLNNYSDTVHYGAWINSLILKWIHDGEYLLTKDNYEAHYREIYEYLKSYDCSALAGQTDYEADNYAGALVNHELTGADPMKLSVSEGSDVHVNMDAGYNYLSFYGQGHSDDGFACRICDEAGDVAIELSNDDIFADVNEHQYVLDLTGVKGNVSISFGTGFGVNEAYMY